MLLIVLDTNVLVSGLPRPFGTPARVLDQVISNTVQVAFDDRILDEYIEVLSRPKFGFSGMQIKALVDHIRLNGQPVVAAPLPPESFPDPGDIPFAEVAVSAPVQVLVTGNLDHFELLERYGVSVLSPREFIESLGRLLSKD